VRKGVATYMVFLIFGLLTTRLYAADLNYIISGHSQEKVIIQSFIKIFDNTGSDLALKDIDLDSSKHCDKVEKPEISSPFSQCMKNKSACRLRHLLIIGIKKDNSLHSIRNNLISAIRNISPLSDILQI
jgi:hypothetical protein